ncbi:MAG: GDP-mannose-dependent alpha-(1-6)-phosphatidylinositol monomannoside mannosyltransferase, partial [Planctomycetota bacterium]
MTLSVHLVQPIVPSYRIPVFRRLATASGIDLTVWADSKSSAASLQGVTSDTGFRIRAAPLHRLGPFFWQPASIAAATSGPDVLLLSWAARSLDLPFALRRARRRGVATVLWGHGFGTSHPILGDLRRSKSRDAADAFLLYGPAGRERLARAGFAPDRLFVAPNAIDQFVIAAAAAAWRADPSRASEFRDEHGLGEDPLLLYVARLEPEKLPQLAIESLAILRRSTPARLAFIGDGAMRGDLEKLARDRGVANAVTFLG